MCKLCETPDLLARMDRVIKALDGGGNFKPDAVRELLADARAILGSHYYAHLAARLLLSGKAEVEVLRAEDLTPPPGGLH